MVAAFISAFKSKRGRQARGVGKGDRVQRVRPARREKGRRVHMVAASKRKVCKGGESWGGGRRGGGSIFYAVVGPNLEREGGTKHWKRKCRVSACMM